MRPPFYEILIKNGRKKSSRFPIWKVALFNVLTVP
jgi:hypothetical protein